MAYVVVRTRREAEKVATLITEAHGFQPDIFRDGKLYRVQHNEIGSEALVHILRNGGMDKLANDLADRIY